MPFKLLLASAIMPFFTTTITHAGIPLHDMYMSNSDGVVYHIDGTTLQATEAFQFHSTNWPPLQIEYLGDGIVAGTLSNHIGTYDTNTGTQELLINTIDFDPQADFARASGLALLDDGSLMTSIWFSISTALYGGTGIYDIATQATTTYSGFVFVNDLYQVDGSHAIAATSTSQGNRISLFDYEAAVVLDHYTTDLRINSFVENNGQLFALCDNGELYQFDYLTGALSLHGNITGFEGDSNSITIPSPTTLTCVGVLSIVGCRRRR